MYRGYGVGISILLYRMITPTKLTDKQKQLLREFADISGKAPGEHEEGFFSKVKRAFKDGE